MKPKSAAGQGHTLYMSNDPSTHASSSRKPSCLSVGSRERISSAPKGPMLAIKLWMLGGLPIVPSSASTEAESLRALSPAGLPAFCA